MIRHQRPRKTVDPPAGQIVSHAVKKFPEVLIVEEYFSLLNPPGIDVLHSARKIDSRSTWHALQGIK